MSSCAMSALALQDCNATLLAPGYCSRTYRVWVVCSCYALAVEQESHARDVLSLAVTEGVHKLAKGGGALDLEEDLVVVVGHLDVKVLALAAILRLLLNVGRSVVRHFEVESVGWVAERWTKAVRRGQSAIQAEAVEGKEGTFCRGGGCFMWRGDSRTLMPALWVQITSGDRRLSCSWADASEGS